MSVAVWGAVCCETEGNVLVPVNVPNIRVDALLHGQGKGRGVQDAASVAAGERAEGKGVLLLGQRVVGDEAGFGGLADCKAGCAAGFVGGWRHCDTKLVDLHHQGNFGMFCWFGILVGLSCGLGITIESHNCQTFGQQHWV